MESGRRLDHGFTECGEDLAEGNWVVIPGPRLVVYCCPEAARSVGRRKRQPFRFLQFRLSFTDVDKCVLIPSRLQEGFEKSHVQTPEQGLQYKNNSTRKNYMADRTHRYQVFVSSTFRDLRKERQAVLDAILEMEHFPAGMEVFPASDATPWDLIKSIISEADYYVLIVGGRYGTTDEDGMSYTEREYDLAVSLNIPVLAFLHGNPEQIPVGMSELDSLARKRLDAFRSKVETHHCKYWTSDIELKSQVVIGLTHAIRVSPRSGWIRGDSPDSAATLKKLTDSLEENKELKAEIKRLKESIGARTVIGGDLASGDDRIVLHFRSKPHKDWDLEMSWDSIFYVLGPILLSEKSEWSFFRELSEELATLSPKAPTGISEKQKAASGADLELDDFNKVIYQFMALDYIEPTTLVNQTSEFDKPKTQRVQGFRITKQGSLYLGKLRAIRKN